jgi:xanthine dehydrogenase accessory factor
MTSPPSVVVRGGGELASAAARLLFLAGFPVAVLEREAPLAVRRLVSFAEAVFTSETSVEGVVGRRRPVADLVLERGTFVPVAVDPGGQSLARIRPDVIVDGRMLKRAADTTREQASCVIGLGPGFEAGRDVHAVVETQRGPDLGRVIWTGTAEPDTSRPAVVSGYADRRVVRAPRAGVFQSLAAIGDIVVPRQKVGEIEGVAVTTSIAGLVRGIVASGVEVEAGAKLGDVDPRGPAVDPARISDKARAVAAGVLEAVLTRDARR